MLMGWSVKMAITVHDSIVGRVSTGERAKTQQQRLTNMIAGAKTVLLAVLPASVIFSMFFDFWDEEVAGRKRNVRPLDISQGMDQFLLSIVERTGHVGTFGMFGEVMNGIVNAQQGKKILSFDERVVWANSLMNWQNLLSTTLATGALTDPSRLTYNQFWRPFLQNIGFGGAMGNVQVVNNVLGLNNAESRTAARININNALRGAGRQVGVEVRPYSAGGMARPAPHTPHVTAMILAAISDDGDKFRSSYRNAVETIMKEQGISRGEAETRVSRSFSQRHPIRSVFRSVPSRKEYQSMLSVMNPNLRLSVQQGIDSFNRWGETIGSRPYFGRENREAKAQEKDVDTEPEIPTFEERVRGLMSPQIF